MPYDLEIPGWHWLCLCHQSRIKQAGPGITGAYPQKGTFPLVEIFLIAISPALRWRPGWAARGGPAFSSGPGQSGGQALGPGPCPNPQPMGMDRSSPANDLAISGASRPRLSCLHAGPGRPIQAMGTWMLRFAGAGGGRYSHFCFVGSPLKIRWKTSFWVPPPSLLRTSGPQVAWLLCRHPSSALPLDPVPLRPAPWARLQCRKFADTVRFIVF